MGIGDWGLGIGDWGLGPILNPQSPIPNPQSPFSFIKKNITKIIFILINLFIINNYISKLIIVFKFKKMHNLKNKYI